MSDRHVVSMQSADFDPLRNPDLFGDSEAAPAPSNPSQSRPALSQPVIGTSSASSGSNLFGDSKPVVAKPAAKQDLFGSSSDDVHKSKLVDLFGDMSLPPPPVHAPAQPIIYASPAKPHPPKDPPPAHLVQAHLPSQPKPPSQPPPPSYPPPPHAKPEEPKPKEVDIFGSAEEESPAPSPVANVRPSGAAPVPPTRNLFSDDADQTDERNIENLYIPAEAVEKRTQRVDELDKDLFDIPADESLARFESASKKSAKSSVAASKTANPVTSSVQGDIDDDLFALASPSKPAPRAAEASVEDSGFDISSYISQNLSSQNTKSSLFD